MKKNNRNRGRYSQEYNEGAHNNRRETFWDKYGGAIVLSVAGILVVVVGFIAGDMVFKSMDKNSVNNTIKEPIETPTEEEHEEEIPEAKPIETPVETPEKSSEKEKIVIDLPETISIDFKVSEEKDDKLEKGESIILQNGVKGERLITYVVTYQDGKEIDRTVKSDVIIKQPVAKVIIVGTKEPAPKPAVTTKKETETEEIAFETVFENDDTAYVGITETTQEGIKGVRTITYEVTYKDGTETDRKVILDVVTKKPVNKIVTTGTKPLENTTPVVETP